jgi:hypothetical protein
MELRWSTQFGDAGASPPGGLVGGAASDRRERAHDKGSASPQALGTRASGETPGQARIKPLDSLKESRVTRSSKALKMPVERNTRARSRRPGLLMAIAVYPSGFATGFKKANP